MLRTDGWGLGNYWCTFTAYCTSYFEVSDILSYQSLALIMEINYETYYQLCIDDNRYSYLLSFISLLDL